MPRRILHRGILLEQNKEPALSRPLRPLYKDQPSEKLSLRSPGNPSFLAPHEILAFARAARIVDESDGRSLWRKIEAAIKDGANSVVVDAIDDEPYISSQIGPALHLPGELAAGIELIKRAIGAAKTHIEMHDNLVDVQKSIPKKIGTTPIRRVSALYPAEYRGKRRYERSALAVGACALIHLKRAVYDGLAQTTAFVTVAGNCTANPGNYEIPLGVTVSEVMRVTGLIDEPRRIVVGGSMTGYCILNPDSTPITVITRGILTFDTNFRENPGTCIGCGRCTESCPEGLSPYHIHHMLTAAGRKMLDIYDLDRCVGCGTCSYVCPAKINLSHIITQSKSRILAEKR